MQAFWQSGPERTRKRAFRKLSGIEAEVHHVAVLHRIFLALQPQLARIARAGLALQAGVISVSDGLGADEALLEIRVDHAGGAGSLGALGDRPGAGFLRADGEVGD